MAPSEPWDRALGTRHCVGHEERVLLGPTSYVRIRVTVFDTGVELLGERSLLSLDPRQPPRRDKQHTLGHTRATPLSTEVLASCPSPRFC